MTLIAAIIALLICSFLVVMVVSLVSNDSDMALVGLQSTQALGIGRAGLERAVYQLETGTACNALDATNVAVGSGDYDIDGTLYTPAPAALPAGGINAVQTTIPVTTDPTLTFAPHGRIRIDSEYIDYAGLDSANFLNARRGAAGTTQAIHLGGAAVAQNQCLIRSTGAINGPIGSIQRVAEVAVQILTASDFSDGANTNFGTVQTTIGTLATTLPAGDNMVVAMVSLRNPVNPLNPSAQIVINAGNLRLMKGAGLLTSNELEIRFGGGAPDQNNFRQETIFLLYKDVGAAANAVYTVTALAGVNSAETAGEVKMAAVSSLAAPLSSYQDQIGTVALGTVADTTILNHVTTLPAGDNLVLAAVQLWNISAPNRTIAAGNLKLKRNGVTMASNQFPIALANNAGPKMNPGAGFLLLYRDVAAPANPSYSVTGLASGAGMSAEVKILVINGVQGDFQDTGQVTINPAMTPIGMLAPGFPSGENIVIAANQFDNAAAGTRAIAAGNQRLTQNGVDVSQSAFWMEVCNVSPECTDFASGLLYRTVNAPAAATYQTRAQAFVAGDILGESKILGIHFPTVSQAIDWREIYP